MGGTNVYIDDLPMGTTDVMLNQICGVYGTVTWAKAMPSKDGATTIGIVELSTPEEAQWFVDNINGNIPEGLTTPIRAALKKEKKGKGYGKSSDGGGKFGDKGFSPYGGASKGGKQAAWSPQGAGKGGQGGQPATAEAIAGFVAQWALDDKAQQALLCLDPETQQRVMNDFRPSDMSRANPMFMGFVKSVAGTRGAPTAQQAYGGAPAAQQDYGATSAFIAQWGLDDKAQQALFSLDPQTQQRVMSDFRPPDMSRANQIFMGFLKSVSGKRGAPTAQQAYGGAAPTAAQAYGGAPAAQQDYGEISAFIAQWGLDDKAQQALLSLDPQTQQRVMSDFRPPDMSRANQIFMGFLKSVSGRGAPTAQQAYGGAAPTAAQAYGGGGGGAKTATDTSRNVYINDLPAEVDENLCKEIFGQYGTVTWMKVMQGKGKPTKSAIVEFATIEESQWFVESLNGNVPQGLLSPIQAYFKK